MEETDTVIFNRLAEEYQKNKSSMIENTLMAGRVIDFAKNQLSHGQFLNWIDDHRVSESIRTAQRLMAIHKDFGHLLSDKNKLEVINSLGITHLLELKKLPDRFRKDIEVVHMEDGNEIKEIKKVIDEVKLGDFLDTDVEFDGKMTKIKELSLSEMNKKIREAQGIYEPDDFNVPEAEEDTGVALQETEVGEILAEKVKVSNIIETANEKLSLLLDLSGELIQTCDKIEKIESYECSEKELALFKQNITQFKSNMEAIYVKLSSIPLGK